MKIYRIIRKIIYNLLNLEKIIGYSVEQHNLNSMALFSNDSLITESMLIEHELVVSLTTYNKRIFDVHLVIESLGRQSIKANRIILWLDKEEFNDDTIPDVLKKQIKRGLEVRFCKNIKSYKKLVPALIEFPKSVLITVDDDILYASDIIEGLVKEHQKDAHSIIAHRIHEMKISNNKAEPYKNWIYESYATSSSYMNLAVGVGGVLYPVNSLSYLTTKDELFSKLAPNADDVWFKAMSILNKTKVKKVNDNRDFWARNFIIPSGQDISLANANVTLNQNDIQIEKVFQEFSIEDKILKLESNKI